MPQFHSWFQQRSATQWIFALVVIAFAARAAVILGIGDNHRAYYEYMQIAQNLLDGKGYSWDEWGRALLQPTSFLPPIYVYWCAMFMSALSSDYTLMYILQAMIAASGCIPAFLIGKRMFSGTAGIIFAALYALYPEFVFLPSRPVTEFLYVVMALWLVYLYLKLSANNLPPSRAQGLAVYFGLLGGFTVLVKESATILIAAILLALAWRVRPLSGLLRRIYFPMFLAATIVMSPWIVRNYLVQGEFIPVRTGYGLTAWIANHHGATGTDKRLNGGYVMATLDPALKAHIDGILPSDEQDRDRIYRAEVKKFIRENPGEYLNLTWTRLRYFVWFDDTHPLAKSSTYRSMYIVLLLFAIPGLLVAIRRQKLDPLVPIGILGFLILYVPVLVLPRYRIIPILFLLLLAAYAVSVSVVVARYRPEKQLS